MISNMILMNNILIYKLNFLQIAHLKDSHTKLYNDVVFLKHLSFFSMIVTIIMAIIVIYILKIDIKNTMDQQACHIHHGI